MSRLAQVASVYDNVQAVAEPQLTMDAVNTLRSRIDWTRAWLTTHRAESIDGDFQIIDLHETYSHGDVISLSSDDPATSCSESASTLCTSASRDAGEFTYRRPAPEYTPSLTSHDLHDWYECTICNPWSDADTLGFWHEDQLAYATAGRPFDNAFRDFRSPSKARNRGRKHRQKYYAHQFVKPGQLGQPHFDTIGKGRLGYELKLPHEAEVIVMDKRLLYTEAQKSPRPVTYHRRPKYKDHLPWAAVGRSRTKLRKQAHRNLERVVSDQHDIEDDERTIAILEYAHPLDGPVLHNQRWREFTRSDLCQVCDLHWSRCYALGVFEVDQIEQLCFELDASIQGGWKLRWTEGERTVEEGFGPNRGDAVLQYGKSDWDPREDAEWFDDRDETDDDVRRARERVQ